MKAKKIAIAVLLSLVMIVSSFLVVACDNTKENRWDILTSNASLWSAGDRNIYDINTTGGKLVLDYTKTGTYQYVGGPIGAEDNGIYKTFVLTASMTTTAETSTLLVKFGDGAGAREFNFELSSTEKTYEIDVSDYDLASKNVILLFADAGWTGVTGKITISEMYLTDREPNADKLVIESYPINPPYSPLPEDAAWNEITTESKTVNAGWYDDGLGVYEVDKNQDGSYTVNAARKAHDAYLYNALLAFVYGDAETMREINSFSLTVNAPKGTAIAVKPFDFFEVKATVPDEFDNQDYTIKVDVSGFIQEKAKDAQGNPTEEFAHNFAKTDKIADAQAQNTIRVIWETGNIPKTGTFKIVSAEFSEEKLTSDEPETTQYADGLVLDVNKNFPAEAAGGVYTTTTNSDGNTVINFQSQSGYDRISEKVNLGEYKMNYIKVRFRGTEGASCMFGVGTDRNQYKYEESSDQGEFTGDWQEFTWKLPDEVTGETTVYIIAGFAGKIAGYVEIDSWELYYVGVVANGEATLDVNKNWTAAKAVSTRYDDITTENGKTTVTYHKTVQYDFDPISLYVDLGEGGYDTLTIKFKGIVGGCSTINFNNDSATEKKYEEGQLGAMTGEEQTCTFDVKGLTGLVKITLFVGWDYMGTENATFEITQAQFSKNA